MLAKRQCILHIGTEKTGSTSIQNVMAALREQLPALGFAYPEAPGSRNHTRLALYAADSKRTKAMARRENRKGGDAEAVTEQLPEDLEKELSALPAGVHTVIFSNEHCHSRLTNVEAVQRLKELLDPFFDRFRIVVYLRRQDELAVSRYSTMLRTGGFIREVLPMNLTRMFYFQYDGMLDRWSEVFGRQSVEPRLFGRDNFVDGDLIRDFFSVAGLPKLEVPAETTTRNPSLIPAAQEFLLQFNRMYEHAKELGRPAWIGEFMNANFAGPSRMPPRSDALRFCAAFDEGNERIRAEYFPRRRTLFSKDFNRYPETELDATPDAAVLDVALKVLCHVSPDVGRQGKRRLAEAATTGAEDGAAAAAPPPVPPVVGLAEERASLLAVLDAEPTHARALRRLVRVALDPPDREVAMARLARAQQLAPDKEEFAGLADKLGTARRPGPAAGIEKKRKRDAA